MFSAFNSFGTTVASGTSVVGSFSFVFCLSVVYALGAYAEKSKETYCFSFWLISAGSGCSTEMEKYVIESVSCSLALTAVGNVTL